jgi:hypothetical protein
MRVRSGDRRPTRVPLEARTTPRRGAGRQDRTESGHQGPVLRSSLRTESLPQDPAPTGSVRESRERGRRRLPDPSLQSPRFPQVRLFFLVSSSL